MVNTMRKGIIPAVVVALAATLAVAIAVSGPGSSVRERIDMDTAQAADPPTVLGEAPSPDEAAVNRTTAPRTLSPEWPFGEVPLAYGVKIPAETVNALLRECRCPLLPDAGPASPAHVKAAWTNSIGDIVLEYDHGVQMSFEAGWEDETNDEWIGFMRDEGIPDQGWGRILSARGLQIFGRERDEGGVGLLAVVHWIEGTRFIGVGGHGGESLSELVEFAESLPACDGCQTGP